MGRRHKSLGLQPQVGVTPKIIEPYGRVESGGRAVEGEIADRPALEADRLYSAASVARMEDAAGQELHVLAPGIEAGRLERIHQESDAQPLPLSRRGPTHPWLAEPKIPGPSSRARTPNALGILDGGAALHDRAAALCDLRG